MSNLKHYYEGLRRGDIFIVEKMKFSLILNAVAVLHAAFAVIFFCMGILELAVYNVVIVFAYQGIILLIRKKKLLLGYSLINIEVILHCILATYFVGWGCGFQSYCVGMVAVIFYVTYTWDCFSPNGRATGFFAVFSITGYLACFILYKILPPVVEVAESTQTVLFLFNSTFMFIILFAFMMLLVWDIGHKNDTLLVKNSQLGEMAKIDPLTKLYNRRSMNENLKMKMQSLADEGVIFGLILGDIDDFKKVNDTYGHECGDEVLIEIGKILSSGLRDNDYVCRWGGEEFLIAIQGNIAITQEVAERIRSRVEAMEIKSGENTIKVTMTFGVCESIPGLRIEKLIQIADDRLYVGKANGKNQVVAKDTL